MNPTDYEYRIKDAFKLFDTLNCCSKNLPKNLSIYDDPSVLALMCEDKMRCHIINCLAALRIVQMQKETWEYDKIKDQSFFLNGGIQNHFTMHLARKNKHESIIFITCCCVSKKNEIIVLIIITLQNMIHNIEKGFRIYFICTRGY
jgi:hypothetical protein